MKTKLNLAGLIKVGKLEHLEALRSKGHIYANTVEYFRNIEAREELKDSMEGANRNVNIKLEKIITGDGKELKIDFHSAKLTTFDPAMSYTRLFCTYSRSVAFPNATETLFSI